MNKYILPAALVASALAATSASAVTISVGEAYSEGVTLANNTTTVFSFTPTSAMEVLGFVINGTGTAADLAKVTFGIGSATTGYASITGLPSLSSGLAFLDGFTTSSPFELVVSYFGGKKTVSFGYSTETAPVPLPAAAPLLVAALGGLGIAARRKAKKAA